MRTIAPVSPAFTEFPSARQLSASAGPIGRSAAPHARVPDRWKA
jgi:hypothetical protein